jgi:hypothetical protein
LGSATKLVELSLHHNQLTGEIPSELGDLPDLFGLALQVNNLAGPVPPELMSLADLTVLSLSGQSGCLTAATPALATWLTGHDALWNDGCPSP